MTVKTTKQTVADKAQKSDVAPAKTAKQPAAGKAKEPIKQPAKAKAEVPTKQSATKPVKQAVAGKVKEPVQQPVMGKVEEPKRQPSGLTVQNAWGPFKAKYLEGERDCNASTLASYQNDFDRFLAFVGGDTPVAKITKAMVLGFSRSPHLLNKAMNPNKKLCSPPTVKKTLRLVKMFLEWLEAQGLVLEAPIPSDLPMGSRSRDEQKAWDAERAKVKKEPSSQSDLRQLERAQAKVKELQERIDGLSAKIAEHSAGSEASGPQATASKKNM